MSAIGGEAAAVAQMQPPPQPQRQACAFSPASVGNVAVGFDILGHPLAGVGDTVTVRRIDAPQVRVAAIRGAPFALPLEAERNTAGAGPSVFAWFESRQGAQDAAPAVQAAFAAAGFDSQAWVCPIDSPGAHLL